MTVLLYVLMFGASVVITLGGCALFTNGIEWLGKRLKVPEGAVGSIFAAVGTTLPETSIPIIAIFFGTGRERTEVGLGAILGAPFMLSTLVLPILAGLLLLYGRMGKRAPTFKLNYREVRVDLAFFLVAYGLAMACVFVPVTVFRYAVAVVLVLMYLIYMKTKFSAEHGDALDLEPLYLARRSARPSYTLIALQGVLGLLGLVGGAHLFVTAAKSMAGELNVSPLLLALLIAPLATELPEMSNSFLWLYQKKDTLAVGNVTGAMVFQGTFPVSVGLVGTNWDLTPSALAAMSLALLAVGLSFVQLLGSGHWRPWLLGGTSVLYLAFTLYLYGS
ncbi:sodium:calcium antiporter [Candidatus Nitrospira bockiana]